MPTKKCCTTLAADERAALQHLLGCGRRPARTLLRAHILLKADQARAARSGTTRARSRRRWRS